MISSIDQLVTEVSPLWAPPPRQTVCEWAQEHFIVATGADKGRFKPKAYQIEPINALGDARISSVVIMSATQMLKTITILVGIAYVIARDPDPIMVVLPRDSDVSKFSKFRLAPMLREMPALRGLVSEPKARDSSTTIDTKDFPGGPLILTAAGSPGNLAAYAIRYLFCDEVDKYPASSGAEGNPIEVALKRTATFRSRRKLVQTCSPTNAGESQIEAAYNDSDQRRFWVPCPRCERVQILRWPQVRFERKIEDIKRRAATATYECEHCGSRWNDVGRWSAVDRGAWKAEKPFNGSAGFWISELYSPFKTLRELAYDFLRVEKQPERLKVFVNTTLAETWRVPGSAPSWEQLFRRRENYPLGVVPRGALFLTAFVDVQENPARLEVELKAWGRNLENWSIWYEVIAPEREGPDGKAVKTTPADPEPWERLAELLLTEWPHADGGKLPIWTCAVDSGYKSDFVYSFCRQWSQPAYGPAAVYLPLSRYVIPTKGGRDAHKLIEHISDTDAARKRAGLRIVTIGTHYAKEETYDAFRIAAQKTDTPFPARFCHFPLAYSEDYFRGLTAETRVLKDDGTIEWRKDGPNEPLDCHVGNRALAELCGISRFTERDWERLEQKLVRSRQPSALTAPVLETPAAVPAVYAPDPYL
jgi:phage terminase large subunit GpA-like protein